MNAATKIVVSGSPPLARRGQLAHAACVTVDRLTSARAERTSGGSAALVATPAHLRSRGEDSLPPPSRGGVFDGSPPLARRGLNPWPDEYEDGRLTSARAERTCG